MEREGDNGLEPLIRGRMNELGDNGLLCSLIWMEDLWDNLGSIGFKVN